VLFLVLYVAQVLLVGHKRFPGDDWLRTAFLVLLGTHTAAAVTLLPLVPVTVYRAFKQRFEAHRRIARVTMAVWTFVSSTGVLVYWLVNHVRPGI
jgi:putative membrane protein